MNLTRRTLAAGTFCGTVALLAGCATLPNLPALPTTANVQAATAATISQAQQQVQQAITLYGIAKGIAEVGATADPAIAPVVGVAIATLDPLVAQAQTALNDATTDAAALIALAGQIQAQASALTLATAGKVTVVPNPA